MRLSWDVAGTGPTLVLLHGFTGSRETWGPAIRPLAASFRIVRVDLPGHGASPPPGRTGARGLSETLVFLERLLRELSSGAVAVAGYSMGARLALDLALRAPALVRALVLESGTAGLAGVAERRSRRARDARLAAALERGGIEPFVTRWERMPVLAGLRSLPPAVQAEIRRQRLTGTVRGWAWALRSLSPGVQPSRWPALPDVRCPTLLLTGALDRKFTRLALRMAGALPCCEHRVVEHCGHAPHLEAPAVWAGALRDFLKRAERRMAA